VVVVRQQPKIEARMNIHRNARMRALTTVDSRWRRVASGDKILKVAADFCVSEQTVRNGFGAGEPRHKRAPGPQLAAPSAAVHGAREAGRDERRSYRPGTYSKAERFIQTSLRKWAYTHPYTSSRERLAALTTWLDHYNTMRPHTALGDGSPAARLRQYQLLCSTEGTVASSRPASSNDRSGGLGQGSPKATGDSRRAASLRRSAAVC
jgi:hypothetical protein